MEDTETPIETPEPTEAEKVTKEREILKTENDAFEAEKLRGEQLRAERQRGGQSEAGLVVEKKVETAEEYSERLERGEANPLHEDNYI